MKKNAFSHILIKEDFLQSTKIDSPWINNNDFIEEYLTIQTKGCQNSNTR